MTEKEMLEYLVIDKITDLIYSSECKEDVKKLYDLNRLQNRFTELFSKFMKEYRM